MKYFSIFINFFLLLFLLISNTQFAYAQTPTTVVANPSSSNANKIAHLQARANKEIDRRVNSLQNKLIPRIKNMKRLTADQKSSLTSQVQTEITSLNNLKTKIAGDTDLATLKADVRSIVTSYRVFALFIPQISLLSAADRTLTITDKINTLATKLQTRMQTAQNKGNDVSSLQTKLTDMQNKISDAKTQANNIINAVIPLTPGGYPGNTSTLQSARTMLQTAHQDVVTARQDAKVIIQGLRAFGKTKTAISPTGTPAPSH